MQIFREVYANVYFKAVFLANVYFTYTCGMPYSAILSPPARGGRAKRKSLGGIAMDCINWNIVGTFAALSFCGLLAAMLLHRPLKAACASFMAMPNLLKVALASIAVVATVQAQTHQNAAATFSKDASADSI